MSFNGNEGEVISLKTAIEWTTNFRNSKNYDGVHAQFYGSDNINKILSQPDCVGIRVYRAIDDKGAPVVILVGTDAKENDLLDGILIERGLPCPPYCGGGGGGTNPLQG